MNYNFKNTYALFSALLFCMSLFSQHSKNQFEITVKPVFKGEKLKSDHWYISEKGDSLRFNKVKFYLTDFKVKLANNTFYKKKNSSYLVDVFDATTLTNYLDLSEIGLVKELCFSLGVRSDMSESGALSGALDAVNGMYWAWQSGYINMKIEGVSPSCPTRKNRFTYHIGGYKEPYATLRKLSFPVKKNQNKIIIELDLAAFINNIDLKENHSLMIPGERAFQLADKAIKMFSINL